MNNVSKEIFDNYLRHYISVGNRAHNTLHDVKRFHLERLPRWINGMCQ